MSDCENIIKVNGLSKAYSREKPPVYAVYHAEFAIRKGETLGLVGESGCGKSTLGRLLLRLEKPTKGTICFKNQDITDFSFGQMQKIRSSMQMIFRVARMHSILTIRSDKSSESLYRTITKCTVPSRNSVLSLCWSVWDWMEAI